MENFWHFSNNNSCIIFNMQLVLSTGNGVNGFTLDPSLGEFILTHPDIKVYINLIFFVRITHVHGTFQHVISFQFFTVCLVW